MTYPNGMTFESAFRLLAEKEPEKFVIVCRPNGDGFNFGQGKKGFWLDEETQDDIDAILAEIGWEYHIVFSGRDDAGKSCWGVVAWSRDDEESGPEDKKFSSKLAAARSALIAVVEKLYGAEITAIRE